MNDNLLEIDDVSVAYTTKGFLTRSTSLTAVESVSFNVKRGDCFGLIGESGCGKTTLLKGLIRLVEPSKGRIVLNYEGEHEDIVSADTKKLKDMRRNMQMVFQDPYASLNPRMTAYDIISEPLIVRNWGTTQEIKEKVTHTATRCGINANWLRRYPHAFSGGQRQRIAIARSIILDPALLLCDEPVSALDVSVQAQIINLLTELKETMHMTMVFVSHDLTVVATICDWVAIMYLGKIVEMADTRTVFSRPVHPYTGALLNAVPLPDPAKEYNADPLEGEIPSLHDIPPGCRFSTRCRYTQENCFTEEPQLRQIGDSLAACHRAGEIDITTAFIEKRENQ